jgi:hypothetical protein
MEAYTIENKWIENWKEFKNKTRGRQKQGLLNPMQEF